MTNTMLHVLMEQCHEISCGWFNSFALWQSFRQGRIFRCQPCQCIWYLCSQWAISQLSIDPNLCKDPRIFQTAKEEERNLIFPTSFALFLDNAQQRKIVYDIHITLMN